MSKETSKNYGCSPKFSPFSIENQVASLKSSKTVLTYIVYILQILPPFYFGNSWNMLAEKQSLKPVTDPNDQICVISQISETAKVRCYNGKWQTT